MAEKESEVTEKGSVWGMRACEELARLSGSIKALTAMVERQTLILGHLAGMMEEEVDHRRWRRKWEGEPVGPLAIIKGVGDEGDDEVEEEVENEGENEEEEGVGDE